MNATDLVFRDAKRADLPTLVAMLANDPLGHLREQITGPLSPAYYAAFKAIAAAPDARLMVVQRGGVVVGTMQLHVLSGLTHQGARRMIIDAVRVLESERGQAIGETMMRWAIARARESGCRSVRLTSHRSRTRAHGFYERLGFVRSHLGFTYELAP
jgi:GNAT superfamily N-acetyltransferase